TSVLEGYGMDVLYAGEGRAGIGLLRHHPDVALVLVGVLGPDLDGYATTAAIRRTARFAELPIVMTAAKTAGDDRERSLEAGASDHLPKPLDVDRLLDVMRNLLPPG
ncbi:response regulator, partial [Actinomadura sp. LOL_011]